MSLKSTFIEMVNHTLVRINQPELISVANGGTGIAGATGRAKSIAQKFNDIVNSMLLEADWWIHITGRSFTTSSGVQDYSVATDFAKPILLLDQTSKQEYAIVYPRAFEVKNLNGLLGGTNFYTFLEGKYKLLPIPTTVLTFRDVYWRVPAELVLDTDFADLPPGHEFLIKDWVYGSISGDMGNFEAKDRAMTEFFRAINKAKVENSKIIDSMLSGERQLLSNLLGGQLAEGQTLPYSNSSF